jgi:hypothetical protein
MNRRITLFAGVALAAASVLLPAGPAHANVPTWSPPSDARVLCDAPWLGPPLGYNLIVGAGFIPGTPQPDLIIASNANDFVLGMEGDDIICLFAGDFDRGEGGEGNDIIFGFTGVDLEFGGPGNDALFGDDGPDDLRGNNGDDAHFGGNGVDSCTGGLGLDSFTNCP